MADRTCRGTSIARSNPEAIDAFHTSSSAYRDGRGWCCFRRRLFRADPLGPRCESGAAPGNLHHRSAGFRCGVGMGCLARDSSRRCQANQLKSTPTVPACVRTRTSLIDLHSSRALHRSRSSEIAAHRLEQGPTQPELGASQRRDHWHHRITTPVRRHPVRRTAQAMRHVQIVTGNPMRR